MAIILKYGYGEPSSGALLLAEPAFDASNNVLWIGNTGGVNIPFYSDASFAYATNASVNAALITYVKDVSMNSYLLPYATNASVNDAFSTFLVPYVKEASIGYFLSPYTTTEYVDGSLAVRDNNITWLTDQLYSYATNTSINDFLITYIDVSFGYRDSSIIDIWTKNGYIDSSITDIWSKINYIEVSVYNIDLTPYALTTYVDSSLTSRDTSLNDIYSILTNVDSSLNALGIILEGKTTIEYVDGSLAFRDSSISDIWVKLNDIDISLNTPSVNYEYIDSSLLARDNSLNEIIAINLNQDISINAAALKVDVDASSLLYPLLGNNPTGGDFVIWNTDVRTLDSVQGSDDFTTSGSVSLISLNIDGTVLSQLARKTDVEASLGVIDIFLYDTLEASTLFVSQYLFDSSLSAVWLKFNDVDASLNTPAVNYEYIDGSLAFRDSSISDIWTKIGYIDTSLNNIPTGGDVTKAYVDASLAERDISINWLNVNKVNGTTRITVSATQPSNPTTGDLWIDIN